MCILFRVTKNTYMCSKHLYIQYRLINSYKNNITRAYDEIQTEDELAQRLIQTSMHNNSYKKEYKISNSPNIHLKSSESNFADDSPVASIWDDYESFKKNPQYQDLTHEEYAKLREIRDRQRYKEFKRQYNIQNLATNPIYQGKLILRDIKRATKNDVPLDEDDYLNQRTRDKATLSEIVSRIRAKIRSEKLHNSKISKAPIPSVDGILLDPIKAHVEMRRVRISTMLATHIEQILTSSSPTTIKEILNGATISVHHVKMTSSKSTCIVYYTILSAHDADEIQQNLDNNAWKVRFFVAKKLQLGYTPPIKFVNQLPPRLKHIPSLYRKIVPPYLTSIEKPLHMQSLINKVDNCEEISGQENNLLNSNQKIEQHIEKWKRVISGFG